MTPSPLITYGPIAGTPFDNFSPELFWLMVVVIFIMFIAAIFCQSDEEPPEEPPDTSVLSDRNWT